jgi:hypothetical protein
MHRTIDAVRQAGEALTQLAASRRDKRSVDHGTAGAGLQASELDGSGLAVLCDRNAERTSVSVGSRGSGNVAVAEMGCRWRPALCEASRTSRSVQPARVNDATDRRELRREWDGCQRTSRAWNKWDQSVFGRTIVRESAFGNEVGQHEVSGSQPSFQSVDRMRYFGGIRLWLAIRSGDAHLVEADDHENNRRCM